MSSVPETRSLEGSRRCFAHSRLFPSASVDGLSHARFGASRQSGEAGGSRPKICGPCARVQSGPRQQRVLGAARGRATARAADREGELERKGSAEPVQVVRSLDALALVSADDSGSPAWSSHRAACFLTRPSAVPDLRPSLFISRLTL